MTQPPIAVLGTGMAGFGAGYMLHSAHVPFVCYDKNAHYGGHTRSIRYESGFTFDEGVHISFTKHNRIKQLFAENVRGRYDERNCPIDNYWRGYRIQHPVQCNLRGLPTDLVIKIFEDFVASRARIDVFPPAEPPNSPHATRQGNEHRTYADWLHAAYGKTFAETFPMAYGVKYHTTTMDQLTTEWIGPRMYRPSLDDLLRGAIDQAVPGAHYVQNFRYPSNGGFVSYLDAFADKFDVRLNHRLIGLDPRAKLLRFGNGAVHRYSAVISSMPLPELIPTIDGVPHDVLEASSRLAFTTAILVNIGVDRADLSDSALTYFYDEDVIFSRVSLPHLLSANNVPEGCGAIQAEVYYSDKYKPAPADPTSLAQRVVSDLRRCGFLDERDSILLTDAALVRYANVIYDFDRTAALSIIHGFLDDVKIDYCGRYGDWNHAWTDEAFISGEEGAKRALSRLSQRVIWC